MATAAASNKREAILQGLRARLEAMPDTRFSEIDDPDAVSDQMALMVPEPKLSPYGQLIGPVYSTKVLTAMWDVTRAAISKKAKAGNLLTLKIAGKNLFPIFQFDDREVRSDVLSLVNALQPATDPFTIAAWLRTPLADDPSGRSPLMLLDDGEIAVAHRAAARVAAGWAA